MNVDIWSDLVCPWCFIGTHRFRAALNDFEGKDDVRVIWHSFQLDPNVPDDFTGSEVDYLADWKGIGRDDVLQMTATAAGAAAGDGLVIDYDTMRTANSRLGHHLVHLAQMHGVATDVVADLMRAHFSDGENIADPAVLRRIGEAHGLAAADIEEALGSEPCDAAMRSDAAQASGIGIQGVPFFVIDAKYAISGAQPQETFARGLEMAANDRANGEGGMCGGGCGGNCGCS